MWFGGLLLGFLACEGPDGAVPPCFHLGVHWHWEVETDCGPGGSGTMHVVHPDSDFAPEPDEGRLAFTSANLISAARAFRYGACDEGVARLTGAKVAFQVLDAEDALGPVYDCGWFEGPFLGVPHTLSCGVEGEEPATCTLALAPGEDA